jgi:hypothetical protein
VRWFFGCEECLCFQVNSFLKKPSPRETELSVTGEELGPEKASQEVGLEIA